MISKLYIRMQTAFKHFKHISMYVWLTCLIIIYIVQSIETFKYDSYIHSFKYFKCEHMIVNIYLNTFQGYA